VAAQEARPRSAFLFSLVGGALVVIGGLDLLLPEIPSTFCWIDTFCQPAMSPWGVIGMLWGSLMMACASQLYMKPHHHIKWGSLIVLLSLLSWIGAQGGFGVGFVLGLCGGIGGMLWNPSRRLSLPPTPGKFSRRYSFRITTVASGLPYMFYSMVRSRMQGVAFLIRHRYTIWTIKSYHHLVDTVPVSDTIILPRELALELR